MCVQRPLPRVPRIALPAGPCVCNHPAELSRFGVVSLTSDCGSIDGEEGIVAACEDLLDLWDEIGTFVELL